MKIDKNWWKHFFNNIYLITDARSVCNSDLTRKEVNMLEKALNLRKNERILDLCGGHGRHSLELAKRGYKDITVLDYSRYLIKLGKKLANDAGYNIKFRKKDARFTGLKNEDYSVIFVMANSFGYFANDKENLQVLKEVYRLLKKGGKLLLDLTNSNYIRNNLECLSWHEANKDIIVCRKRSLRGSLVKAREIVISKREGLIRDGLYCERLYSKEKILHILKNIGFKKIAIRNNQSLHKKRKDYGLLTSRMSVTAEK